MLTTELINEIMKNTFPTAQALLEIAFNLFLVGTGIKIYKATYHKFKDLLKMLCII